MEIKINNVGNDVVVSLAGRLDTVTAPDLEKALADVLPTVKSLVLDFGGLEYLSSAGLRVLLNTQKAVSAQGKMVIKHVNDVIMDVFDMTGFSSILTIED